MSAAKRISTWFKSQCNGDWEHGNGITIESLDNPGWVAVIDLDGTNHENLKIRGSEGDIEWEACNRELIGTCGAESLEEMLAKLADLLGCEL